MTVEVKEAPVFDRDFLVDLGGWTVLKQAQRLVEAEAVKEVSWDPPILSGVVGSAAKQYHPHLNLRSTVFAENKCSCIEGRRGQICAHAVAICLAYQAKRDAKAYAERKKLEAAHDKQEATQAKHPSKRAQKSALKPEKTVRNIKIDRKQGASLRVLLQLPPNFSATAPRDAIMVKLEAAIEGGIIPLEKLEADKAYSTPKAHEKLLCLVEFLCGGKLASLLQLTRAQLRMLLEPVQGAPVVYWMTKPDQPIAWEDGTLPGVHELLESEEAEETSLQPESGSVPIFNPDPQTGNISLNGRPPSQENPRRAAEAGAFKSWNTKEGDYPAADHRAENIDAHPTHRVIVDGSPNFLAIRLPRDESVAELRTLLKTANFILDPTSRQWWLRDRHRVLNFLAENGKALQEQWNAIFTGNYNKKCKPLARSSLKIKVEERGSTFRFRASLRGGDALEMRKSLASGKKYIEEEHSGRIVLIDTEAIDKLHEIERCVSGQSDRPFSPQFEKLLSKVELADVEALIGDKAPHWKPPAAWKKKSRALREVGSLKRPPIPGQLDKKLRSYQRVGVAWLWHLYRNDLGGILADEMGLGKTIQALGLITCACREDPHARALVVVPASLVENWSREAKQFVPDLKIIRHHGPSRATEPEELDSARIVVTSYGTLQRDCDLLRAMRWTIVIGDEAQHIKNRKTQNAHALRSIGGEHRFLLTGTPVENSLDDLYSLFEFLMPGYLTQAPSKASQDDKDWYARRQTQRAAPYILRRTKREVAPELPEKIEETFYCSFGSKQDSYYHKVLEKTRRDIFEMEMSGASEGRVRMAAFTELLRLRQVCVDPRILNKDFAAEDSAKWRAFDEILSACIDSGSRILVFSSFVKALKLLSGELKKAGHRFCYIDGSTRNRQDEVDRFNNDDTIPVFLISLKAGGTGLNLTGADTVVHYDPWWNPAAEAQATDRAHRIGQTRVVTSIRLIAANSIEEKVLELQQRKAGLLKELFEESQQANGKVSLDDIKELLK